MTTLGQSLDDEFPENDLVRIPEGMPHTHLLPGVADTLRDVNGVTCRFHGVRYGYADGMLKFLSPRGARVEVALLVDSVDAKVNDVVVATDIAHPEQVAHERLRETLAAAFAVLNGLAAAVEQKREDRKRADEQAVQHALDSL